MNAKQISSFFLRTACLLLFVAASLPSLHAQNFRGAINGTVTDSSGALIPGATVQIVNVGTNASYNMTSTSAGQFAFDDLPLGSYNLTVTAAGFSNQTVQNVPVSAGQTYTQLVKMSVAAAGTTVQVQANALALDTTSTVQSNDLPTATVQNVPLNGRDFTQLLASMPGYAGNPQSGGGSVNGARSSMTSWQIEGSNNNDIWWNLPAANQSGISSIAGTEIPIDAIDQTSVETAGNSDNGGNPGATVNLVIKSGTNQLHGTLYYYNRNEALAVQNPFSSTKPKLRDQQFGYSAGGPLWKDKFFFFTTYEDQRFVIGTIQAATEPSAAYQTLALQQLAAYGIPESQAAVNMLNGVGSSQALWPASALTGPATPDNYISPADESGFSHNGIIKLDYILTQNNKFSFKWYIGQGTQTAPTSSALANYFEVGPTHIQNYTLAWNTALSARMANQLTAGVNYYNQTFNDADHAQNPLALGLNTGVTNPALIGSPRIEIGASGSTSASVGFDELGVTPPEGRNDIIGSLNEDLTYTVGRHEMRFGGDYVNGQIDDFYQNGQRGTFVFDGTQGPWSGTSSTACAALRTKTPTGHTTPADSTHIYALADFLAGCFDSTLTQQIEGNPKRQVFEQNWAIYGQDSYQLRSNLNVNFGLRYSYLGPMHDQTKDLATFLPGAPNGLATAGVNIANVYPGYHADWAPHAGFSWQPFKDGLTVVRGGFGMAYDWANILSFLNDTTGNGGPFGVQDNPAGAQPVQTVHPSLSTIPSGAAYGEDIFPVQIANNPCIANPNLAGCPTVALFGTSQQLRPGYLYNYNLQVQRSLGGKTIAQIGYVGTAGRDLRALIDVNQAALGSHSANSTRPYFSQYPNYSVIDVVGPYATSNYNSLQALVRTAGWHNLTGQLTYTYAHSLDENDGSSVTEPQNSLCFRCDYGNAGGDIRQQVTGYFLYSLPAFSHYKLLTNGWQLNSLATFHTGAPFTIHANSDESLTGENEERANPTGVAPYAGVNRTRANGTVNWMNPNAYSEPAPGTFGTSQRDALHGPAFRDFDLSVFKNTKVTERITTQFRVEMFNLFNFVNLAPVGDGRCNDGSTCAIKETAGVYSGAPGIGSGEPFNTQLALKIIF
jgi:Carboxypeptidase regulatory-like domain/TonB dependent receptor